MIRKADKRSDHSVHCGICQTDIKDTTSIYQIASNLAIVCNTCYRQFSSEDLELMMDMFMAFGGYFGMIKDSDFSLLRMLEEFLKNTHRRSNEINTDQINIQLMHNALLNGISPEEYIKKLALLVED